MVEVKFWKPYRKVNVRHHLKPKMKCYQGEKLDRQSAVYVEGTKFMCSNCMYYRGRKCAIVKGVIRPTGCCNLFKSRRMVYKR